MIKRDIIILDYGSGNIGSLVNMFRHIGASVHVVSEAAAIPKNSALVLPGVGHFGRAAEKLENSGLAEAVVSRAVVGTPVLGVCVGMQLLLDYSGEGNAPGLGLIKGQVRTFDRDQFKEPLPLPNVGWRFADPTSDIGNRLLANMPRRPRFYFTHGYHAECANPADAIMEANYGYRFTCAVASGNITGLQFHPEKSHAFGMTLLANWIKIINDQ